ncbi:MAG: hypothetical protein HKN76_16410 [Saprospiraceae bacterium]|nr:hypothetical protein [Saprospiraceae bacterium]
MIADTWRFNTIVSGRSFLKLNERAINLLKIEQSQSGVTNNGGLLFHRLSLPSMETTLPEVATKGTFWSDFVK